MSKVFISYKHRDGQVQQISGMIVPEYGVTTARNYVDILDVLLTQAGHICKAEDSGEDLSGLTEDMIAVKLADRLYDSTATVVLISKGMHEAGKAERDQWIPWEVSYSLRENTRGGRTSATNAMIAVVLPDEYESYGHFVTDHNCPSCRARIWHTDRTFKILGENMFNRLQPKFTSCQNGLCGLTNLHIGSDHSYIHPIKWEDFVNDLDNQINLALARQENLEDYDMTKLLP